MMARLVFSCVIGLLIFSHCNSNAKPELDFYDIPGNITEIHDVIKSVIEIDSLRVHGEITIDTILNPIREPYSFYKRDKDDFSLFFNPHSEDSAACPNFRNIQENTNNILSAQVLNTFHKQIRQSKELILNKEYLNLTFWDGNTDRMRMPPWYKFQRPLFNEELNFCMISYSNLTGCIPYYKTLFLEKINGTWEIKDYYYL